MKTMLFNPYTGTPRHPSDIRSDPTGALIKEPDEPMRPAADPGPMAATVEEAARDVSKCLAERGGQGLDLRHVAMLVHHAQQPDNRIPMGRVAERKLADLQAKGHTVCGVMIQRAEPDGTITRGAVSDGGMVIWWHPEQQSALYEELRAAIDAGSETATHADALNWVKGAHHVLADVHGLTLTDEQCDAFRRLPMPFNDMVRAIYRAGVEHRVEPGKTD